MKNVLLLSAILCLIYSVPTSAQTQASASSGTIKGVIIDSLSKKPQDFITIALKKADSVIKTLVTESDGTFKLDKIAYGKYTLTIVALGYKPKTVVLELTNDQSELNLGKITVTPEAQNLDEVSVTAAKPLVSQEIDRITYDIQADPESKVSNVLDMMRKIPLLSVDAEDNIKLKGSGNYKILINGRPSSLVARDPKDVFKSMPAANIEKIEVITTPPAKYDSEGLAGLINIITKKNIDAGYNGSLNGRYNFPAGGPGGSGSLTVKEGKFGISAYGGVNFNERPATENRSLRNTFDQNGALDTRLTQDGSNAYKGHFNYGSAELSYEIDSLNLITGEFSINASNNDSEVYGLSTLFNSSDVVQQRYRLGTTGESSWTGMDLGLNYQLGFKKDKNQLLTFSYRLNNSDNTQFNNVDITERVSYPESTNPNYKQNNDGNSREQTIQADYVQPFSKKLTMEAGLKGILRNNSSEFEFLSYDQAGDNYVPDPTRTNNFNNDQNVYGVYNSYQYNLTNWGFKAGARLELTTIDADFISQSSQLNKDFFNLIPSISVNRKFKDLSSLNFGYTQRIERPGIWQLNPFVNRVNPNFEYGGNPDLRPVVSNSFEANYSKFKKGSINIGLNYNFANNTIQNITTYNDQTKITRTTYMNVGKDRKLGSNFNINYPFTKDLNLNMGGNLYYVWLEGQVGGEDFKNEGMQGYMYAYIGYKLKSGWRVGANYSYSSPWITLQGQSNPYHYFSMSVNKDIIKDKLSLSASVNNPFQKYRAWENETSGPDFYSESYSQSYYRSFTTSLNWRFGKLKESIKKNRRGINNDDVKSGGGGSTQ